MNFDEWWEDKKWKIKSLALCQENLLLEKPTGIDTHYCTYKWVHAYIYMYKMNTFIHEIYILSFILPQYLVINYPEQK